MSSGPYQEDGGAFLKVCSHIHVLLMQSRSALVRISLKMLLSEASPPSTPPLRLSFLFTMFLQPSALMPSPGKEGKPGVGRTFQYSSNIKYCKCIDQFKSISRCGLCGRDTSVGTRCSEQLFHYRDHQHLPIPAGDRHVLVRVWTDCLQALTHVISQFRFGFHWESR